MKILTSVLILAPAGGIELSTLQDGAELVRRGHSLEAHYQIDGPQRRAYGDAGISLGGPLRFSLDRRNPLRSVRDYVRSARAARHGHPDVLWLNRPEHIVWAQLVAWICNVPIVGHLHNAPKASRPRLVNRLLFHGVSHFFAVSEFTRRQWIERGVRADRVSVLHNAIPAAGYPEGSDADRVEARTALGLPHDGPTALFYGRIGPDKGVPTLLEAWHRLGRDDATLMIVGRKDEHYADELERALAELPAGSYRLFPEQSDVVPFLHAADVVVVPTPQHEAFGRAVLEGLMTGRPVIGTTVGGIPEVLDGASARFLVPPSDPDALAARLRELLDWRATDPGLGERSRTDALSRFPYEAHVDALERNLAHHSRAPRSGQTVDEVSALA